MKKLLLIFFGFVFFYCQKTHAQVADPAVTAIQSVQTTGCFDSASNVVVGITNYGTTLDLSINNLVVNLKLNGPYGLQLYRDTLTSGIVGFNNTVFLLFPAINLYNGGCYSMNTTLQLLGIGNPNLANDSLPTAYQVCNSRPTGNDYFLCKSDTLPSGQGLSIINCPTAFVQDSVLIPFTLSFTGNYPGNPTACAATGSSLFATGTLPTLPSGANILGGQISVSNLSTSSFPSPPLSTIRFSLFYGNTPTTIANVFHNGLAGTLSTAFGCFDYLSNPPATDLNLLYTSGIPNVPNLNMGHWSTTRCTATSILANCSNNTVSYLKIYYEYIPTGIKWYEQPSGGVSISNASVFNPLQTPNTILNNSNTGGTYTFYGACEADTNCRVDTKMVIGDPQFFQINKTNVSCNGLSDGSLSALATGGAGNLTYSLLPGPNIPSVNWAFNNLAAGTYTVRATDVGNCTIDTIISITQPPPLLMTNVSTTTPSCVPGCDGTMTITASGGTGTLIYHMQPGPPQVTNSFFSLCSGAYSIIVMDANACTTATTVALIPAGAPTWGSISSTPSGCGDSTGSISLTATVGTNPIIAFSISPAYANTTQAPAGTFNNLPSGAYQVRATDGNGCSIQTSVVIGNTSAVFFDSIVLTDPSCYPGSDGSITIYGTGGIPPYNYTLGAINGTSNTFSNLSTGSYYVRITDSLGCSRDTTITLVNFLNNLAWATQNVVSIPCNGTSLGSISFAASGGVGTIAYSILPALQPANTSGNFSQLPKGNYIVGATDANGCYIITQAIINEPPPFSFTTFREHDHCLPYNSGYIRTTPTGGTTPYSFFLNTIPQSGSRFDNLAPGTYNIKIVDANGCMDTASVIVGSNFLHLDSIQIQPMQCSNLKDASIQVFYSQLEKRDVEVILCQAPFVQKGDVISNLDTGWCMIRVHDPHTKCEDSMKIYIPLILKEAVLDSFNVTPNSCNANADGMIVYNREQTPFFDYEISPQIGEHDRKHAFTALPAGTYIIKGSNDNGCIGHDTITVNNLDNRNFFFSTTKSSNVHCYGSINAQAVGGLGNYTYSLQPKACREIEPGHFDGLCWGNYNLIATDSAGCSITQPFSILQDENAPTNMFYHFSVYPNPANNVLYLKSDYLFEYEVSLINIMGQNTLTQYVHDKLASIPVGNLTPGVYILRFKSDVDVYERKIIIQR